MFVFSSSCFFSHLRYLSGSTADEAEVIAGDGDKVNVVVVVEVTVVVEVDVVVIEDK